MTKYFRCGVRKIPISKLCFISIKIFNNKIMYFKILSVKKKYIDILLISPESDIIIVLKKPEC